VIIALVLYLGATFWVCSAAQEAEILMFVMVLCSLAFVLAYFLIMFIMAKDDGTREMKEVVDAIRLGSEGFFRTQYSTIFRMSIIVSIALYVGYLNRPTGDEGGEASVIAAVTAASFLFGALCSALAGYIGLYICVRSNARVASAARVSYTETMRVAMVAGAIPALIVVAMVVSGICFMYGAVQMFVATPQQMKERPEHIPLLLVGFGFGASFVALFAQLGGGIFTKAADVGADLVGKVEQDLDEDDARNPAVIADLVGDNVGDCAGRGADLFESIAAEIVAAMVLGGTMARHSGHDAKGFMMFPLVVHGFDLVVSSFGLLVAYMMPHSVYVQRQPLTLLKYGYYAALSAGAAAFWVTCQWLLNVPGTDSANCFFGCGMLGMAAALLTVLITQYYTDYIYYPVRSIAQASVSGHATNIITGTAVGMESTTLPCIVISIALLGSYYLGRMSGINDKETGLPVAGLFGTAVATMGMLSSACFVLTMDFFGPIADNAGGIVEMGNQPESVREVTDLLDAVGNTTKAATKGFAIGSASLACFLLFSAFMDEVSLFSGTPFTVVDVAQPEIFVGGLLGATMVMLFSSWSLNAVSRAAQQVVAECRQQFQEHPGIMQGTEKPDYKECVSLITTASLHEMVRPGLLAVSVPIIIGLGFKYLGQCSWVNDPLLGPKAVAGMLMFSTVMGVQMSLYMNNAGGAWDNAKKLVETGAYGGKNSDAHKAVVTGDTVGDPFKDTAGPSLHVLIKLLSTITLVMTPLFVTVAGAGGGGSAAAAEAAALTAQLASGMGSKLN
jgi:H(+)-translocating pyrophosphatase